MMPLTDDDARQRARERVQAACEEMKECIGRPGSRPGDVSIEALLSSLNDRKATGDQVSAVESRCQKVLFSLERDLPWVREDWLDASDRTAVAMTTLEGLVIHFREKQSYLTTLLDTLKEPIPIANLLRVVEKRKEDVLAVLVHVNDTYALGEQKARRLPGFPRVIATIKRLRRRIKEVLGKDQMLVLHSGDFLGPSRSGKATKGMAITKLLRELTLDWCVLGNHEFDYKEQALVDCATSPFGFKTVLSNVSTNAGMPISKVVLWPERDPLIALTGVVSKTVHDAFPKDNWLYEPPEAVLQAFAKEYAHVPFRVVLTHATRDEDRALRRVLRSAARTLVLGGHDHDMDWIEDDGPLLSKNLSNLQTVKFFVLFAGGYSRVEELLITHDNLLHARCSLAGVRPHSREHSKIREATDPLFPFDNEQLLGALPRRDAQSFRRVWKRMLPRYASSPASLLDVLTNGVRGFDHSRRSDVESFKLGWDDHDSADQAAQAIVENSDREVAAAEKTTDEDAIVRRTAGTSQDAFDCRDVTLRGSAAPFGFFAAECVRRELECDFVLLNSGTFRVDAMLPVPLLHRDLLDCFLYDSNGERTVIVLRLARDLVAKLIEHGQGKPGTGAFPQCAPLELPPGDVLSVAISSYLLESDQSIDGYDTVYARWAKIGKEEVRRRVHAEAVRCCRIVPAVRKHAEMVSIPPIEIQSQVADEVEVVIALAEKYIQRLEQIGLERNSRAIASGEKTSQDPELAEHRQVLRDWLETFMSKSKRADTSLFPASHEALRRLIDTLEVHPKQFARRRHYGSLIEAAANGLFGWSV